MAKVTVKLSQEFKSKLKKLGGGEVVDQQLAQDVGTMLVDESKRMIAAGISPVKGVGRFEAYKNPANYPGDQKPARPVNLSLTGTMLSYLNFRKSGQTIEFGILNAPAKVATYARVHNTGERSDIPRRQFLPDGSDDEFVPGIAIKIRDFFRKRAIKILGGK